jgi:branched-chain amino acid transport system substrate-binding protein
MQRTWRRALALAVSAALGVGLTACSSSNDDKGTGSTASGGATKSAESIKLPAIEMLTGDVSYYGQLFMQGIDLAVDEINAAGGVNGAKIELIKEDNASGNTQTVTLLRKYCADKSVGLLIAPTYQVNSDAGGPVSNACGLPTITGVGDIDPGTNPRGYMFKNTTVRQPDQVEATMKFAIEKTKAKRVAHMTDEAIGPWVLYRNVGSKYLKRVGIPEVGSQSVKGSVADYGPQITALAAAKPDLVVIALLPTDAAHFIEQARGRGLKSTFVATCGCMNDPTLYKASHGAADGFLSSSANPPPAQADLSANFASFVAAFEKKFGKPMASPELQYTYDSVKLAAEAIKKAGTSTDREKLKQTLEDLPKYCGALCYVNAGKGVYGTTKLYFTRLTKTGFVTAE